MLNSVAAGRRLARRTVGFQAIATAATTLGLLIFGGAAAALGALAGGAAVTLGSTLAAWRAMGGGVIGSGAALLRLILATVMKWMVVVIGLVLALSFWQLPPGPVFAGAVVATLAWLPAAVMAGRADKPATNAIHGRSGSRAGSGKSETRS